MKRDRNFRTLIVIAVLISIAGISVAFAALTQTLTITGQAKVGGSQWRVEFVPATLDTSIGGKAEELDDPVLTATNFTYDILLKQPGDYVTYTFDVKNLGTIDAKVDSPPVLTGVPSEYADDILYAITYSDDTEIQVGDVLDVGASNTIKVVLMYKTSADTVPDEEISMTLNASIIYIQK